MKQLLNSIAGIGMIALPLQAEILNFDLSPLGTSAAAGLSPANEVPPATGTGSGGETFSGITFDTLTNQLAISVGYGEFAGFTHLTGAATAAHLHGPAAVDDTAPPVYNFITNGKHLYAPVATDGGAIIATVTLSPVQAADLVAGQYYINIHTLVNPAGEIRGQLIPVLNSPPSISCPDPVELECTSHDGSPAELNVNVDDVDGDELIVVWTIDGVDQPEIVVPSGGAVTSAQVSYVGQFSLGEHQVSATVTDGEDAAVSCDFTVTVVDRTAPVIKYAKPNPSVLWPPNHKMTKVYVRVKAEDLCGEVTTEIVEVTSNEAVNSRGDGNTSPDWEILGGNKLLLRAERSGRGEGRIYTIVVKATDESGNEATTTTEVVVPHSKGKENGKGKDKKEKRDKKEKKDKKENGNGKKK